MSDNSSIEWTDATWNPVTGCTEVSPGCDNCYAKTFAERFRGTKGHYFENGFDVQLRPDKLELPLHWRKPRRVFVNSMSDLFHERISDEFISRVFAVMAQTPQHTYQILTKRHARMRSLLSSEKFKVWTWAAQGDGKPGCTPLNSAWPLPNVWVGVSVENQKWANTRIPALLDTPAAVRFLSCEPLLGPVDLDGPVINGHRPRLTYWLTGRPGWGPEETTAPGLKLQPLTTGPRVDWVIIGGESGHGARPMHPEWARQLRDQCTAAGVPFHFKQWGEWGPAPWVVRVCDPAVGWQGTAEELAVAKAAAEARGATHVYASWAHEYGHDLYEPIAKPWSLERAEPLDDHQAPMRRWGKKHAGRQLDGRTWDEFPAVVP
jgi:protein gp37